MNGDLHDPRPDMVELFADGIERVLSGESIDTIANGYPAEVRDELRGLLEIAQQTITIRALPVPTRSPLGRRRARRTFVNAVAHYRRDQPTQPWGSAGSQATPLSPWQQIGRALDGLLLRPLLRFAPITVVTLMLLAVLALGGSGVLVISQAAVPGDLTYPVKQWVRDQQITFAAATDKTEMLSQVAEQIQEEVQVAAARVVDANQPIRGNAKLFYYGRNDSGELLIGALRVTDHYRTGQTAELRPAQINGDLKEGAYVSLDYQILPASSDGRQAEIQGMEIRVLHAPAPAPIPTASATPTPTATPTVPPPPVQRCVPAVPRGWVVYRVQPGDTLSELAARSGTSLGNLRQVNCLSSNLIVAGNTLYGPPAIQSAPALVPQPSATQVPTSAPTPTESATAAPTLIVATATPLPSPTAPQPTDTPFTKPPVPIASPTPEPLPVATATFAITPKPIEPTASADSSPTAAPEPPTATATTEPPTATATPQSISTPPAQQPLIPPTPKPIASPTPPQPTATPVAEAPAATTTAPEPAATP